MSHDEEITPSPIGDFEIQYGDWWPYVFMAIGAVVLFAGLILGWWP